MKKILKSLIPSKASWERKNPYDRLKYIASWFAIMSIVFSLFYFIINQTINLLPDKEKSLFTTDNFKVLILPFQQYGCQGNYDCGEIVAQRLSKLNDKDTLNIEVKYLPIFISPNFTADSVELLQKKNKADLIIYGSYFTKDCTTESDDQICFNYICNTESEIPIKNRDIEDRLQLANLSDIKAGKLQGNIDFIIYWIAGRSSLDKLNYLNAKKQFVFIIDSLKNFKYEVYFNLSLAYFYLNEKSNALNALNKTIEFNPKYPKAYINSGVIKIEFGDFEGAYQDYNKAISLNPKSDTAYYNRGNVMFHLGDTTNAINDYCKAIGINPNYVKAYVNRGFMKALLNDNDGALNDFNYALKLNPKNSTAHYNRANMKYISGNYKAALDDYNTAIELRSDYADTYCNRGVVKKKIGDQNGARLDFEKAIQINTRHSDAYFNLGSLKYEVGDISGAQKDFDLSIEFNPSKVEAYNSRGVIYKRLGLLKNAMHDYNIAVSLNPQYAIAYHNRAALYLLMGDTNLACIDFQYSIKLGKNMDDDMINRICKDYDLNRN